MSHYIVREIADNGMAISWRYDVLAEAVEHCRRAHGPNEGTICELLQVSTDGLTRQVMWPAA
jgi:hypothetical protein